MGVKQKYLDTTSFLSTCRFSRTNLRPSPSINSSFLYFQQLVCEDKKNKERESKTLKKKKERKKAAEEYHCEAYSSGTTNSAVAPLSSCRMTEQLLIGKVLSWLSTFGVSAVRCDNVILCFIISHKFITPLLGIISALLVFVFLVLFVGFLYELFVLVLLLLDVELFVENSLKKQHCTTASMVKFCKSNMKSKKKKKLLYKI